MSATFSQAAIAEKIEAHTAEDGRAVVFFGSHKITIGKGSKVDGQLLHGVVDNDGGTIIIEIAQIAGAQMLEAVRDVQIGFGAP